MASIKVQRNWWFILTSMVQVVEGDVEISMLVKLPTGDLNTIVHKHTVNSASGIQSTRFRAFDGEILSVKATGPLTNNRQSVFVTFSVTENAFGANDFPFATLISGYLSRTGSLAWPGSKISAANEGNGFTILMTPSDPAAGANFSVQLLSFNLFRPTAIFFTLTTDANAGNRNPIVKYLDPTNVIAILGMVKNQPASSTFNYSFSNFGDANQTILSNVKIPMPDLTLLPANTISSDISSIQAGDQISNIRILGQGWYL